LLAPRVEWVSADDEPGADWMAPLGLLGEHNRRNALIARRCLLSLGIAAAGDEAALREAAAGYPGLPSRLTDIGTIDGVTFVDDSLSTNVLPTLAALDAFPGRRVALIVGGHDRGIDYAPLADGVVAREAPTLVLTLPDSGPRIRAAIESAAGSAAAALAAVTDCPDLDAAVAAGFDWARPDGIVLLSPAAPSFGQFRDYRDRGDAFAAAMRGPGVVQLPRRLAAVTGASPAPRLLDLAVRPPRSAKPYVDRGPVALPCARGTRHPTASDRSRR
jgi:UDP-N-acetylmuramoylalanine--D-glutamate ligase